MSYDPSRDWDRYIAAQEDAADREIAISEGIIKETNCAKHSVVYWDDDVCPKCDAESDAEYMAYLADMREMYP